MTKTILLPVLLLAGIAGAIAAAVTQLGDRPAQATEIASVPAVGDVTPITGTDVLMVSIRPVEDDSGFSKSKTGGGIRNAVFLSGGEQGPVRLFKDDKNLVRSIDPLTWRADRKPTESAVAIYVEYADLDTNGDERLDHRDSFAVALARPDGTGVTDIERNVARVLHQQLMDDKTLALVYQRGAAIWHARYRLDTLEKIIEQKVVDASQDL